MRRPFINFTFRIFEAVERADSMDLVDGFISGCNEFLSADTLQMGTNSFGAQFVCTLTTGANLEL